MIHIKYGDGGVGFFCLSLVPVSISEEGVAFVPVSTSKGGMV